MNEPLTNSEKVVFEMCRKSCLRFWCYNNPRLPDGKEMTDVLVVFGNHILIISVKEIGLKQSVENDGMDEDLLHARWNRRAVEASVKQVYGAEKSLRAMTSILNSMGEPVAALPEAKDRVIHRLVVAFGSRGETVISSKDYGRGFVHVMNELSYSKVLSELDTISELVEYFVSKERVVEKSAVIFEGDEGNLLAYYLSNNRGFPLVQNLLIVSDDTWDKLQNDSLFNQRKRADIVSYWWDNIINFMGEAASRDIDGNPLTRSQKDLALRIMAQERRFERRALATAAQEFLKLGRERKVDARVVKSSGGEAAYVWRFFREGESSEQKIAELMLRSHLVPKLVDVSVPVIGIGFDQQAHESGFGLSLTYLPTSELSVGEVQAAENMARQIGIFSDVIKSDALTNEYPLK